MVRNMVSPNVSLNELQGCRRSGVYWGFTCRWSIGHEARTVGCTVAAWRPKRLLFRFLGSIVSTLSSADYSGLCRGRFGIKALEPTMWVVEP